jgi:DNA-binding transcriptional regulator YdaS (Cro superfamily)
MDELRKWRLRLPENQQTLAAAGRLLGISEVQMHRYEAGQRRIPPTRVVEWEKITGIPRHVLRPDVFPETRRTRSAATSAA